MTGPVTLKLGAVSFDCFEFGYIGIGRNLETPWAATQVVNRLDMLQWTGPRSDQLTIKGAIFPAEYGGLDKLNILISAATAGKPQMLVALSGDITGFVVIEGITEDRAFIDRSGIPRKDAYEIKLKRYAGNVPNVDLLLGGIISLGF